MALSPGTRFGSYDISALLGAGGMGEVYRARDSRLKREVALKVLTEAFAADPERLARFQREAELLASLHHPHIAGIHGLEEQDGIRALVLELVEGETLAERSAHAPLPLDEALLIARQIAEALQAAHEQGIIHRDLKPANIKVTPDGTVKVLDFGLAKLTEGAPAAAGSGAGSAALARSPAGLSLSPTITSPALLTGAGMILGTAAYMSPEQAKGRPADKRSDVWAFGCVLFEMLTGKRPFPGDDVSDVLASVLARDPDWSAVPAGVPAPVQTLLTRCLEKDRHRRVADIAAARFALEDVPRGPAATTLTVPGPRHTRERIGWFVAAAVSVALVASVAFGAFVSRRAAPAADPAPALVRFSVAPPSGGIRRARTSFAVSPDGQTVAFGAQDADGVRQLFIRRLDAVEARVVDGAEGATGVFWSPDSRALGFGKASGIYRSDLDGTPPRRLCAIPGSTSTTGGTWNASGVIVFGGRMGGLYQVAATGGTAVPVTTLDAAAHEGGHYSPWFLPDGRHLLFLAMGIGEVNGTIWVTALDDPARTRLVESSGPAAYGSGWLLYTTESPARTLVAQTFDPARLAVRGAPQVVRDRLPNADTVGAAGFTVSATAALVVDRPTPILSQLTWMDRTGRAIGTIGPRAPLSDFALAPDERQVVTTRLDPDVGRGYLWLFDSLRDTGTRLTYGESARRPLWAHDSRHIYFTERTEDSFTLRTLALGGAASTAVADAGPFIYFEDVTRDGRFLVFKSLKAPSELWLERVGTTERRPLVQGPYGATQARVSPDGRWLAYVLLLPSGEVFVQPFDRPGDRLDLGPGLGPIWRHDGRELYVEGRDGLLAVTLTPRGDTLDASAPQHLFAIRTQGDVINQPHNVEVAAHGERFLVNAIVGDSDNAPLEVTLNWTTGLTK